MRFHLVLTFVYRLLVVHSPLELHQEWDCIAVKREVDAYLEAFLDEREDGYLRIPETSRNEYLATGTLAFFSIFHYILIGKGRLKIGEINETKKKGNMQLKSSDICRMKL
ncbi:hypothetical protein YC2023_067503 [Brassica napus]